MHARFHDGSSTAAHAATVAIVGRGAEARLEVRLDAAADAAPRREVPLETLRLEEHVGSGPRLVLLPGGESLEIADAAAFESAILGAGGRVPGRRVGRLERRWRVATAAVVAVVALVWGALHLAGPALARHVAAILPPAADRAIGEGGLRLLDSQVFAPSELPAGRRAELQRLFGTVTADAPATAAYRLELRRGGPVGANAFALPAGIVVVTDELVELAEHDDELRAVLAHEVGHLVHRHSLRLLVQNSLVAVVVATLLGDVGGTSALIVAVPTVLVTSGYSRDFEREADDYAYDWMRRNGVAPQRLGDLLRRLEARHGGGDGGYLSTHPATEERVRRAADDGSGTAPAVPSS